MLIGIMSDSHGRHLTVRSAVEIFREAGVAHVIHCGDVGGLEVFEELLGLQLTFVWGNTDEPAGGMLSFLHSAGVRVPTGVPTRTVLDGRQFAIFHGHEADFPSAPRMLRVDYILHGHTHVARDERVHGVRVINPGALHRAQPRTIALLDTQTDELTFLPVDG